MRSNLVRFVHGQITAKSFVISSHLWLEHLLIRSLFAKLPNPDALFKDRPLGFQSLVTLNEALGIIEPKLAGALHLVNTMRNKCAHHARYKPLETDFQAMHAMLTSLGEALPAFDPDEWGGPLEIVAELLEHRARAIGATDVEALLPEDDGLDAHFP